MHTFFKKPRPHTRPQNLSAIGVTRSKSYTQGPQTLLVTVKNILARLTQQPAFLRPCTRRLRKCYVYALHYLYSWTKITRMTTSDNVGSLRYVEIKAFKIWVTKLKAVVSNLLGTRDQSREKFFEGHSINNSCIFPSCIINGDTLSATAPKLVRRNLT